MPMNRMPSPAGEPDRDTLRRASLKVALRISAACAVLVLCLLAAATVYLMNKLAHPDLPGSVAHGEAYTYLDSKDLIEAMIIAGVAGIVLAGVVGWLSARSAIRPLGEALALQRRFVQDASHELRTPLAILDARIQLAQRDANPDSKPGRALGKIREDAATLTGIVNELLLAATGAAPDPAAEPVELADVAEGRHRKPAGTCGAAGRPAGLFRRRRRRRPAAGPHRPELLPAGRARPGRQCPGTHGLRREHHHQHRNRGQPGGR